MWLVYGLLASALFACINIIDSHCVNSIFHKPWMGTFIGAITTSIILLAIFPFIFPLISWESVPVSIILISLLAGVLLQLSNTFYFNALSYSEAGIVSAYWNMVPTMVPLASFVFFKEILSLSHYAGISIIVISSVLLCLVDSNIRVRWNSFLLMIFASLLLTLVYLLQEIIFASTSYFIGFFLIHCGVILSGFFILATPEARIIIKRNISQLIPMTKVLILFEVINLAAVASLQKSIDLGIPSRVAAIEAATPGFTFIFLLVLFPISRKFRDPRTQKNLLGKIILVGTMVYGVTLLT